MDDELLTTPQAAAEFAVSAQTLMRLAAAGLLPAQKQLGVRALLMRRGDVREALARRRSRGWPKGRRRAQPVNHDDAAQDAP